MPAPKFIDPDDDKLPITSRNHFTCRHCGTLAEHRSADSRAQGNFSDAFGMVYYKRCSACKGVHIFHQNECVYPVSVPAIKPNPDLDKDIQEDFQEAVSVLRRSPRAACALFRLCVQKICKQLGEKGEHINTDIGNLVKKGLQPKIQQALDIIRVIGNNAVHPGQIDLKDDYDTALTLANFINLIAEQMITMPKEVEQQFESLPIDARKGIAKRDAAS